MTGIWRQVTMDKVQTSELCSRVNALLVQLEKFEEEYLDVLKGLDFNTEEIVTSMMIAKGYLLGDIEISDATIPYLETAEQALTQLLKELGAEIE
jgi:hypothetical protein